MQTLLFLEKKTLIYLIDLINKNLKDAFFFVGDGRSNRFLVKKKLK